MAGQLVTVSVVAAGCVLAAAVLAACRSAQAEDVPAAAGQPLDHVAAGATSAIQEQRVAVARTPDELAALWAEHGKLLLPHPPPPEVDLDGAMVVAVFLGSRPTAGYSVRIEAVESFDPPEGAAPCFMVRAVEEAPGPDVLAATVITAPYHLVRVPALDGEAVLQLR